MYLVQKGRKNFVDLTLDGDSLLLSLLVHPKISPIWKTNLIFINILKHFYNWVHLLPEMVFRYRSVPSYLGPWTVQTHRVSFALNAVFPSQYSSSIVIF